MHSRLLLLPLPVLLLVALASPAVPSLAAEPHADAGQADASAARHAAAVVIDTGTEVRKVCVRFDEPELTGEELLRRAKVEVVFAEYSIGMAVCSLCGVGCPADDCFCESTTTGRYWNYSRGGGAGWERSHLGASATTVRDGDVEGWAWGVEGATPPWIGFESICVEVEPSASASPGPRPPAATTTPQPAASPQPAAASPSASRAPAPAPEEPARPAAGEPVTEVTVGDEAVDDDQDDQTMLTVQQDGGGSGLGGVAAFALGGIALAAGMVAVRRRLD